MTKSTSQVLILGEIVYAKSKLNYLKSISNVIHCESQNRDEFIHDLQGKYSGITNIYRTFHSISVTGKIDSELIKHFPPSLKSISHCGAGYDSIDAKALLEKNILLSNVTDPVISPTADAAIYLVLGTMRKFHLGQQMIFDNQWKTGQDLPTGNSPQGKTLGFLGLGGIARNIRDKLELFGFERSIYYNRSRLDPSLEKNSQYVSFDELLAQSDVLILALPLNPNTKYIINDESISKMKDGVFLINIARGAIIDEKVLPKYLTNGKIQAFGSDVFENEPDISPKLYKLPNVICLPHLGTNTHEASENMENWTLDNIISYITTNKLKTIVPEHKHLA